jgi:hypothetical protein
MKYERNTLIELLYGTVWSTLKYLEQCILRDSNDC